MYIFCLPCAEGLSVEHPWSLLLGSGPNNSVSVFNVVVGFKVPSYLKVSPSSAPINKIAVTFILVRSSELVSA